MKQTTLSLWLGGVLLVLTSAAAQAAALSLEQTLDLAERYSAQLSANRNQVRAFGAMADSARQLPDPELKFGIENLPVQGSNAHRFTREGMTMQRVGVMQKYVSADKRDRKADTLLAQSASASAQAQVIRAQLQRDTAQAWLDLALSEKAVAAAQQLLQETEKQIPVQRSGVASGSASASGALALQTTLSALRDNLTLAERDVRLAQTRLYQLTGENIDNVAGALPRYQRLPADEQVLEQGVPAHPEVVQAAREADVAKARSAQSAVASKPDVGVEVYYARRAEEYGDLAGVMFTVDMPLFQSHRQDKDYAADVSRAMEANDQLAQATRDRVALVRSLVAEYQAAQTLWSRKQQEIVPLNQQRLKVINAEYRSGQASLDAVLEARRGLLDAQLGAINAEKEMAQRWAAVRYLTVQGAAHEQ
ncbi:TolC family protein [Atlantibacter subterranea]|uniref:TolC family protein n=2 Tax=Atlantibacter subterraneus TaxID=255519 RepID=A0A3R9FP64_9ENTR|nr:TolC family protein [Atlantibacter subterranea]MDA3134154.1 TolC family protein [Atlantibacter subterranea]RSB60776.1 TolC family protein [Atlantibacter subterranea]RSE03062.1 TolC family protein [Atlantibacter subterranea]RSE23478.1 TolC family protein [Atlantibacter subterranea]